MEQQSTKARVFQDLVKRGMNPIVAAGWAGNWDVETGGFKQMQEQKPLSGEGGLGWGQWTGPRRQAFLDYANQRKLNPNSYDANFGYAVQEMEQGQHMPRGFNDYLARVAKTPGEAAALISQYAQRPAKGMEHNDLRMASAEELVNTPVGSPETVNTPANPKITRANVSEMGEAPQEPTQPKARMPIKDFASGSIQGGLAGMANPGYQDVGGYSDDRLQGLIGLLLAGAMGGQRSRERTR